MMQIAPIPVAPTAPQVDILKPIEIQPRVKEDEQEELLTPPCVLHGLGPTDRLLITKRLKVKNVMFLRGKRNRFYVRTPDQNLLYTIEEENSWWVGYLCYGLRPLQLHVSDSLGREVMTLIRPFSCTTRVFPCQLQYLQVQAPPGHLLGTVEQQWSAVRPTYTVRNKDGQHLFWIRGPYWTVSCFKDIQFQVTKVDGTHVGATCKRWQGLTHAMFTAPVNDRFGVAFDRNLSDEEKGLLMAATLLMDYMYYDV